MLKFIKLSLPFLGILYFTCAISTPLRKKPADKPVHTPFQVSFDKNVETFYIVLMLTGKYNMLISPHPSTYKYDAEKYFKKFNNAKAIKLASVLIDSGFSFDYAASWICRFSELPDFQAINKVSFPFYNPKENGGRNISEKSLDEFQDGLRDFYITTKCDSFFKSQNGFLSEMVKSVQDSLSKSDLAQIIENYYGIQKNASFNVILSPLLHSGGFGVDYTNIKTNRQSLIAMLGPNGEINQIPVFDIEYLEQDLVIHEFGHSYEHDIVEQFMPQTTQYESHLFPPVKADVENEGYSSWPSFMHELIDRAVTIRIVNQISGPNASQKLMDYEKSVGFNYIQDITAELQNYEKQRDKYKSLKDFYPQLIKRLGSIKG